MIISKNLKNIILLIIILLNLSCDGDEKKRQNYGKDVHIESPVGENKKVIELNQKGIELSQKNKFEQAENAFLEALEIEPKNYVVLNNYGLHKTSIGDLEESINLLELSLTLSDSTYLPSAINLSRTYHINDEFEKGINIATYAINQTEDNQLLFQAYVHRIGNYISSKRCETAINEKRKILKMFSDLPNADFHFKKIEELFKKNCGQHGISLIADFRLKSEFWDFLGLKS